jgi:hypothetical protein
MLRLFACVSLSSARHLGAPSVVGLHLATYTGGYIDECERGGKPMRSTKTSVAALLALSGAAAALLWRSPRARDGARRMVANVREQLRGAGIPARLNQWRAAAFRNITSQAPGPGGVPGALDLADENLTITQRVRTNLGREPALADLPHLNINTQERGVVYLRGYVQTEEQRRTAETVAANTKGVSEVVNELNIERAVNL